MKLRTGLQLGAFFPIAVALMVTANISAVWLYTPRADGQLNLIRVVTAFIAIVALLMAEVLYRTSNRMMRRIADLEKAAVRVRSGDLKSVIQPGAKDEIGDVADTFNEMVSELRGYVELIAAHNAARRELADLTAAAEILRRAQIDTSDQLARLKRAESVLVPEAAMLAGAGVVLRCCTESIEKVAEVRHALAASPGGQNLPDGAAITASLDEAARSLRRLASFCMPSDEAHDVNAHVVVDEAAALARMNWLSRPQPAGDRVTVRNDVADNVRLHADRAALLRVLVPLIVNAGESMPEGGVVRVDLKRSAEGNVLLSVVDFGMGMNPASRDRCFQPFFSTRPGASGIGLSIVKHIARQQGWKVGLVSAPGHGTTVCLEVPLTPVTPEVQPNPAEAGPLHPLRVLLAEDDDHVRDQLARGLSKTHRIHAVANGEDALAVFAARPFDVVVTDRGMPGMSGDELAAEVKQRAPQIPVVMVTGMADPLLDTGTRPPNVDVVLGKPTSAAEVLAALSRFTPRA